MTAPPAHGCIARVHIFVGICKLCSAEYVQQRHLLLTNYIIKVQCWPDDNGSGK